MCQGLGATQWACQRLPSTLMRVGCRFSSDAKLSPELVGRLPDGLAAGESFAWLRKRFDARQYPSRGDYEAALERVKEEEDLDACFATAKLFRDFDIEMRQETAAGILSACLRTERLDVACYVLDHHRELRVWPAAPEFAAVAEALLPPAADADDEDVDYTVRKVFETCRRGTRLGVDLAPSTVVLVVESVLARFVHSRGAALALEAAGGGEIIAGAEGDDSVDANDAAANDDGGENDAAEAAAEGEETDQDAQGLISREAPPLVKLKHLAAWLQAYTDSGAASEGSGCDVAACLAHLGVIDSRPWSSRLTPLLEKIAATSA